MLTNVSLLPAASFMQLSQRITVYPELITQRCFWLQLYNIDRGILTLYFYTLAGRLLFKGITAHKEHFSMHAIPLPESITSGIYKIAVSCGDYHYLKTLVIS
jgi:hypothetical protein